MGKDCWERIDEKGLMGKDCWERIDGKGLMGKYCSGKELVRRIC